MEHHLVASAAWDNTIRFWNMETCELLLTLFPESRSKWVAWTPEGLYAASEGGEALLEFHVNQGARRPPLVYPASHFPGLKRPDTIRHILTVATAQGSELSAADYAQRQEAP